MNILEIIQFIEKEHHYKLPDFFSSKKLVKIFETLQQIQIKELIDEYIDKNGESPFKVALTNQSSIVPFKLTLNNHKNKIWFYKNNLINPLDADEKMIIQAFINNGISIDYYYVNLNKINDWFKENAYKISETKLIETLQKLNNRSNSLITKNNKGYFRFEPSHKENQKLYLDISKEPQILTTWEPTFDTEMIKKELISIIRKFPGSDIDVLLYELRNFFPDVQKINVSRTLSTNPNLFNSRDEQYFITSQHDDRSLYPMLILFQLLKYRYEHTGAQGVEDNGIPEETLINILKKKGINIENEITFRSTITKVPLRYILQKSTINNKLYYQFKRDDIAFNLNLGKTIYYNFCPICGKEIDKKRIEITRYIENQISIDEVISNKLAIHIAEDYENDDRHYLFLKKENLLRPSESDHNFTLTLLATDAYLLRKFQNNDLHEYQYE